MSLVTRTVTRNILPSAHVLLSQVGAPHANNPTAALIPTLDEDLLARILKVPVKEIRRRRHLPTAHDGFVSFFGASVRSDEIIFRHRRFAPATIAISSHMRALWSLKTVPCCIEGWQYLTDVCVCGSKQRWQSAYFPERCDNCNACLSEIAATPVPPDLRESLGFLIGLLDPIESRRNAARALLPGSLAIWDGGMVFELALALLPLTSTQYHPHRGEAPSTEHVTRYTRALSEAANLIRGWPTSLTSALESAIAKRAVSRPNVRYTGVADYVRVENELLPMPVKTAIQNGLATLAADTGATPPEQISMREAMRAIGHNESSLAAGRRDGLLQTKACLRSNRLVPTLDRAEVEHIAAFVRDRVGSDAAGRALGLPQYAISMLADEGLLQFEQHPYLIRHYDNRQIDRAKLAAFQDELRRIAMPEESLATPVALHRAARALGGGLKPWGSIFRELIDRKIPFSVRRARALTILIAAEDVERLPAVDPRRPKPSPLAPHCNQADAIEILNLPLKHAHLLDERASTPGGWDFRWSTIEGLAMSRITLAEMSARTGMHPTTLECQLDRIGLFRADTIGWEREQALEAISTL